MLVGRLVLLVSSRSKIPDVVEFDVVTVVSSVVVLVGVALSSSCVVSVKIPFLRNQSSRVW